MPLYEYLCEKCGGVFERIEKFSDPPKTQHDECGGAVHRLISAPALQFKGSGWYVNDYGKGGVKPDSKSSDGSKSDGSKSDGSKSDGSKSDGSKSSGGDTAGKSDGGGKTGSDSAGSGGTSSPATPAPASSAPASDSGGGGRSKR